jgi:hypothetical protein
MLGYNQEEDGEWTKQTLLPEFCFDETAKTSSEEELFLGLPSQLAICRDGIPFKELLAANSNDMPATSNMLRSVLAELAATGAIKIKSSTGELKRRGRISHPTDVIIPTRQTNFLL